MNIEQAKEQIYNAITAYLSKDEFGSYRIPIERQRPIFLIGPPVSEKLPSWNRSPLKWVSLLSDIQ